MPQYPAVIALSTLNGTNGFRFSGSAAGTAAGFPGASAGDVNADGYDDLIVGSHPASPGGVSFAGEAYVVFGGPSAFPAAIGPGYLDGETGFRMPGAAENNVAGLAVGSAGDINGDGMVDLIVGAPGASLTGATYIVYGHTGGYSPVLPLSSIDGTNGFRINGEVGNDRSGRAAASAGDFNGDGIGDVIIGAYLHDPGGVAQAGASYIVFGNATGFAPTLSLSSLNGTNGFEIDGAAADDRSGLSVASAGDVNGDGFDDVIIGAYYADPGGHSNAGAGYVVFGHAAGFAPSMGLSSLNGTNGFKLNGVSADDRTGMSVASAGDINGDGFDDVIVGADQADPGGRAEAGAAYVVFGHKTGFPAELDLSSLNGINGFKMSGEFAGDHFGRAVASAGDVNGDGFDDIVVGAYLARPSGPVSGVSYVIFGKASGFASDLALSTLDGSNGFQINAVDNGRAGLAVGSVGDFNRDGLSDLVISAPFANPNGLSHAGEGYVLFGRLPDGPVDRIGTKVAQTLVGGNFDDTLSGGGGNDTLWGHGGSDRLVGGAADDTLIGDAGNDSLFGGVGDDTLDGGNGNDVLSGGTGIDVMSGGAGNDIFYVDDAIDMVADTSGTDRIYANTDWTLASGVAIELMVVSGTTGVTLTGNETVNRIVSGAGNDTLDGRAGNDRLEGGVGDDTLIGGAGFDILYGGDGDDVFKFNALADSPAGSGRDVIKDFVIGNDRIDVSAIDAVAGGSDDAFTWLSTSAFTGNAGELRQSTQGGSTIVSGDVDGDRVADFQVALTGNLTLTTDDFIL
jgi:hypothetical protein